MYTYRKTKMVSIQCFSNFQSAIEVFMVLTVRENAKQLVILTFTFFPLMELHLFI